MSNRPNIILCICDQLRSFEVGCYGNPVIRTPNIDRLAHDGVRFETAVTNFPACMAARSVLLSGRYNRSCTGGVSNIVYPSPGQVFYPQYPDHGRPHLPDPTLPELLRGMGYDTSVIGKWHVHSWPQDIGFDRQLIPRMNHAHSAQLFSEDGGPEFSPDGYSVDYEAGRVEEFIEGRQDQDRPFFLYYSISPPHCPLRDAPDKYLSMYDPKDIPLRPNVDPDKPIENQDEHFKVYRWDYRFYNMHLPHTEHLPEDYDLRRLIADYYGLTTWVDDSVGRMLSALDRRGLSENTIVVFTSDHGDNLGSLGLVQKGGPNEEAIRIPLVIRGPGCEKSVARDCVASLVDVMPTLLELAGANAPGHMHGQSLAPVLRGDHTTPERNCAFIETPTGPAIRTLSHVYSLGFAGGTALADAPWFFHDLATDPYQMRNLAGSGEQDDVARELDARLRKWDASTPWMTPGGC